MTERDFSNVPVMFMPDKDAGKALKEFKKIIEDKYHIKLSDYWDLHKWSVEHIPDFWAEVWDFIEVIYSKKFDQVIDMSIPMSDAPKWFEGAKFNYAENLLKHRDGHTSLIVAGEDRETERVTYADVYEEVKLYAAALRKIGVKVGDRVICFMSNRKEAIFAFIATASIGAIFAGAHPLSGAQAVLNRFSQIQPKVFFTVDRFQHSQQEHEMLHKVKDIVDGLPSLERVIVVPSRKESKLTDIRGIKNGCFLDDFLELGRKEDGSFPPIEFEQLPFSHPITISYTSGTTGLPKPLVHGAGILVSISRDFYLHGNSDRNHVWLSTSPVGWVSWNAQVTLQFLGVTTVLYEGSPFLLHSTHLWDMVDEFKISNLFIPPNILDEMETKGYTPKDRHSLVSLKFIMSGGSVVKPQNYDFVYKKVKQDVKFYSAYVSTELMAACMIQDQTLPVYKGEITCPCLGSDIDCIDETGKSVIGEIGELVIKKPLPSLPLGLWNDSEGTVLKKTYFSKFPNGYFEVGDLGIINPITKGIIVCGRSDDTLKPRGTRFGSAEIYNIVNVFPEVDDSLCVSQYNKDRDERAVLFIKMKKGHPFNDELLSKVRTAITKELSVHHVPDVILETTDIPHNVNGKKMEGIVKKIINKMPYDPLAVTNPACLKNYCDVPELQGF